MFARLLRCLLLCLQVVVLAVPMAARAESGLAAPGAGASARLDFRIIIPPVMRLLDDIHPEEMQADAQGRLQAAQTLIVLSNLKRGFCMTLRRHTTDASAPLSWHLRRVSGLGITADPAGDGWRLCAQRPGRYTLHLQHEFQAREGQVAPTALAWPVATDLAAI